MLPPLPPGRGIQQHCRKQEHTLGDKATTTLSTSRNTNALASWYPQE